MRMSLTTKEIHLNLDGIWYDSSLILKAYGLVAKTHSLKAFLTNAYTN